MRKTAAPPRTRWLIPLCGLVALLMACIPSVIVGPTFVPPTNSPLWIPSWTPAPATATITDTPAPTSTPQVVFGAIARQQMSALSDGIGERMTSTEGETRAAEYIMETLKGYGYEPELQPFKRTGWVGDDEILMEVESNNVVAVKPGDSPKQIVVGAHYDAGEDVQGADDNASGVGVLLELAALLKDKPTPYTIVFIAFGAEEAGPLGSVAYVDSLSKEEIQNIVGMVNLDSVSAGDHCYAYSPEGAGAILRDWALDWAKNNGYDLRTIKSVDLSDDGYDTSDYGAFHRKHIPFVYFEATNWDLGDHDGYTQVDPKYGEDGEIWHTEFDTLEYLDKTFPGRVDQHLGQTVAILYNMLTQFVLPE